MNRLILQKKLCGKYQHLVGKYSVASAQITYDGLDN